MPVRKSNVSAVSNDDSASAPAPKPAKEKDDGLNIEDLNLPKSIVQRLGKGVLPPNTQIQKDALLAMSKSATVFVNYLTSTAAEHAARTGKKTVMPKDVFDAMTELEFSAFLPRLEAEVGKFTSIQADKRNSYRKKVREDKKAAKGDAPAGSPLAQVASGNGSTNGHRDVNEESPPTKRLRRESGDEGAHGTGSEEEGDVDETGVEEPDEEVEEDEIEEEVVDEGLLEDPLEDRPTDPSDDEMADGDESD